MSDLCHRPSHRTVTLRPNEERQYYRIIVPVQTMLGDIVVSLKSSRCVHVLRPVPSLVYQMIGIAIDLIVKGCDDAYHLRRFLYLTEDLKPIWNVHSLERFTIV